MRHENEKIGVPELARLLKVNPATIRSLIYAGQLTATVEGRNLTLSSVAVKRFLGSACSEWYTVEDVAEKCGICTMTVRREMHRGKLAYLKVGAQYRISGETLEKYFENK